MTKLGRYEIIETIGTGSMGTVYRARDTSLDREVALKTIRTGVDVDPELRERFQREAKACARLQHPGVVAVFDMGEVDSTAFIAMELLVGYDLRKLIERKANIPLSTKIETMITVCQALAHAHQHGITHRDVKPSNLFLLDDGRAKVLDFGIARLPSSQLTVAGKILGTPNYMAPEQILMKPTGPQSDLFSAAVVFFEFLVYQHPFHSRLLVTSRIAEGEPDSLFDHDTRMPILLERILQRGMAKNPEDRYKTGNDFANDLKAVLDAVNNNASPSFAPATLPSDRAPIEPTQEALDPAFAPNPALLRAVPEGQEDHEWRLSEVLRLIPEFEGAVDRRDLVGAKQLFTELVTIQSIDGRFSEAVALCRTKLGILDVPREAPPATSLPATQSEQPSLPKYCVHCRAANRTAAVYCIQCGATFAEPARPAQPQPAPAPMLNPDSEATILGIPGDLGNLSAPVTAPSIPVHAPAAEPPRQAGNIPPQPVRPAPEKKSGLNLTRNQQRVAIVAAGTLALIVLAVLGFSFLLKPVPVESFKATAVVGKSKSGLAANPGEEIYQELTSGQKLNILDLPGTATQEWIKAQFVPTPSDATRPGYIRIADLNAASWQTTDPDSQLALIRLFHAGGTPAGPPEVEALKALVNQFPGSQAAHDAQIDLMRFAMDELRRQRQGGMDITAVRGQLAMIRAGAADAANDPALREQLEQFEKELNDAELAAKQLSATQTPAKPAIQKPPLPNLPQGPQQAVPRQRSSPSAEELLNQADSLMRADIGVREKRRANLESAQGVLDRVTNSPEASAAAKTRASELKSTVRILLDTL